MAANDNRTRCWVCQSATQSTTDVNRKAAAPFRIYGENVKARARSNRLRQKNAGAGK